MLKIIKTTSDGHTGHISIDLQVMEVDGNSTTLGAVETHGIAAQALKDAHNGDVKAWLKPIHREMLQRHADRKIAAKAIADLQSTTILKDEDIENEPEHQT